MQMILQIRYSRKQIQISKRGNATIINPFLTLFDCPAAFQMQQSGKYLSRQTNMLAAKNEIAVTRATLTYVRSAILLAPRVKERSHREA
jgi:hypothetical protein